MSHVLLQANRKHNPRLDIRAPIYEIFLLEVWKPILLAIFALFQPFFSLPYLDSRVIFIFSASIFSLRRFNFQLID